MEVETDREALHIGVHQTSPAVYAVPAHLPSIGMPNSQSSGQKSGFLRVYKRQEAVKVVGGWSPDDSTMPMDEKNAWRTYGMYFGRTFSIWAKGHGIFKTWRRHDCETWVYRHLPFVRR